MTRVDLAPWESQLAGEVAWRRCLRAWEHNRAPHWQQPPIEEVFAHLIGAAGECAAAKALDVYWPALDPRLDHAGDLGKGRHVRTCNGDTRSLILHPGDPDNETFILVACLDLRAGVFDVAGWLWARDGKQRCYWRDDVPHPAYFVPRSELETVERFL